MKIEKKNNFCISQTWKFEFLTFSKLKKFIFCIFQNSENSKNSIFAFFKTLKIKKNKLFFRKKEIKVCINGCEVLLRHCRSFVMFEIETFTNLISKSLPLRLKSRELQSIMAAYSKARRPQLTAEARGKKHALKKYDQFALNTSCFWGNITSG